MWMQECNECGPARTNGLQSWMRHLTERHVLPTEWPSERAIKLSAPNSLRPYTTVTESKKKRRKDCIPRPLNSFMIFAQHIRRNVLRVFKDASNSVISQQLGDLWRNVPQEHRSRYDDEANRLVKIHQLEFPNYKYQPKKRQLPGSSHQPNGSQHANVQTSKDSLNRTVQAVRDFNCPKHGYQNVSPILKKEPRTTRTEESILRPIDYIEIERYLQPSSGDKKPNYPSLSSVLPPLLTPASKSVAHVEYCSSHASCDSAYGSGINSSSSSSASSPVVGDLLSPLKLHSGPSPARRKIQIIPARPQSQQCVSVVNTTRQRFLSAQHGASVQGRSNGSTITNNNHHSVLQRAVNQPQSLPTLGTSNHPKGAHQTYEIPTVHRLISPMYVRLNGGLNGKSEQVLLELPPGTTIIQPSSDLMEVNSNELMSSSGQHVILTQAVNQATSVAGSHIQTLKLVGTTNSVDLSHVSHVAPTSSLSPSSSSCLSPPCRDVFITQKSAPTTFDATSTVSGPSSFDSAPVFTYDSDEFGGCDIEMGDQFDLELDNYKVETNRCDHPSNDTSFTESGYSNQLTPMSSSLNQMPVLNEVDMTPGTTNLSEFDLVEENYESQFDAMMNSIDITAFSPTGFSSESDDTFNVAQPTDRSRDEQTTLINKSGSPKLLPSNSVIDVEEMLSQLDENTVIIQGNEILRPNNNTTNQVCRVKPEETTEKQIGFQVFGASYSKNNLQHSQLLDLDCLDKSSLFSAKSELAFRA